jgi:hypothetical protein
MEKTFPIILTYKFSFKLFVCREKSKFVRKNGKSPSALTYSSMDQRLICLFFAMKRLLAQAIDNELAAVLFPDAIGYSTVTNYLRQRHSPSALRETPDEPAAIVIDNAILDALERHPFSSIRELAQLTCIPRSTAHRQLTQSLGLVVRHLRWVPHSLTAVQKAQRATLSNGRLGELCSIKHHGW